jgi:hypothetical protein
MREGRKRWHGSAIMPSHEAVPAGYAEFLANLKQRIQATQLRASVAVNRELVLLYWGIGPRNSRAPERRWLGIRVIERLARDLRSAFPGILECRGCHSVTSTI